jgi:cellulose synthase (UDP-forming)
VSIVFALQTYPGGANNLVGYTLPYLVAAVLTAERLNGRFRRIFSSELYETIQAFYILPALVSALLRPNSPIFHVTPKGEKSDVDFISELRLPFYFIFAASLVGLVWGGVRLALEPESRAILVAAVAWIGYNLFLSFGALGALLEKAQRRVRPRIVMGDPVTLVGPFGKRGAVLVDANELGLRIRLHEPLSLERFALKFGDRLLNARVISTVDSARGEYVGLYTPQSAEEERAAVVLAYGDSERWLREWKQREAPANFLSSFIGMLALSVKGAHAHARHVGRKVFHG